MKKVMKVVAALMLTTAMLCIMGCKKSDDSHDSGGNNGGGGSADDHEYVDLGLPSGTLWAICNVGADTPEGYGDYFAWGETTSKTTYTWNTYKYRNSNSEYDYNQDNIDLTKYCNNSDFGYNGFTDNLTTLLPEDDAATANWGNGWRTPTLEEISELYNNTTKTWTQQNGVNGHLFIANNGNGLFLPAAGAFDETGLDGTDEGGVYWLSSLDDTDLPYRAMYFNFGSSYFDVESFHRYCGFTIRPVRSAK